MVKLPALPRSPKGEITFSLSSLQSTTNASDYVLEQRVQRAYHQLLFDGLQDLYHLPGPEALTYLVETVFAEYFTRPSTGKRKRGDSLRHWQAEERLQYDIPEVIQHLPRPELEAVHALLTERDLAGAIRLLWYEYRPQLHKLARAEPLPDDSRLYAAAGLGQLGSRKPTPRPTPCPIPCSLPAPTTTTVLLSVLAALTTPSTPNRTLLSTTGRRPSTLITPLHHLRVKRAQERKRLKRKRR